MPKEYRKEYLKRLVKIGEIVFIKDNDYGYHAVQTIFNYLELVKLEIITTNKVDTVINYLNNIAKAIDYIIDFKPHRIKSIYEQN